MDFRYQNLKKQNVANKDYVFVYFHPSSLKSYNRGSHHATSVVCYYLLFVTSAES